MYVKGSNSWHVIDPAAKNSRQHVETMCGAKCLAIVTQAAMPGSQLCPACQLPGTTLSAFKAKRRR